MTNHKRENDSKINNTNWEISKKVNILIKVYENYKRFIIYEDNDSYLKK